MSYFKILGIAFGLAAIFVLIVMVASVFLY